MIAVSYTHLDVYKRQEKGCELEDIASLLPQKYINNVEELKQEALAILKHYEVFEQKFWI